MWEEMFSLLLISSHNNLPPFCQTHPFSVCVNGIEAQGTLHQSTMEESKRPGSQWGLRSLPPKVIREDCSVGGFLVLLLYPNTILELSSLKRAWPTTHNEYVSTLKFPIIPLD